MSERGEEVGCDICSSPKGMAATEEQLLCTAGFCLQQPEPSSSSALKRLENLALHLFLGEETSCLPCFAVQILGWIWWWHLCCTVAWGCSRRGDGECRGPVPGQQKFVVLLQSKKGKALALGAERWPKSPNESLHSGGRGVWATCFPCGKAWC